MDYPITLNVNTGKVDAKGIEQLAMAAKQAGASTSDLNKIFRKIGKPMLGRARQACPIGKTRRLYKSIKLRVRKQKLSLTAYVPNTGKPLYGGYAAPVHWTGKKPNFMKNAMDNHLNQAYNDFEQSIQELLKIQGW